MPRPTHRAGPAGRALSYIDELAALIRAHVPSDLIPDGDPAPLFRTYALLALAKGEQVVLEDVHDAWSAWMTGLDPGHRSLRPLAELSPDVQRADQPYLDAIRAVARDRRLGRRGASQ
jgi:hypothetical protein